MNALDKFRYLGLTQTARKYLLKAERAAKRAWWRPPSLPRPVETIDLRFHLLDHDFDLRAPNRWHRSPDTRKSWPLSYSQAIPLDAAGDVKLIWELNRHQFLPSLAARDPELARCILRDWIAQNPYEFGINWNSAMEVGLRLIAWLETFERAPQLRAEFDGALAQHARFVRHNLSSDWIQRSNHLVAEAAALSRYEGRPHRWLRQAAAEQLCASGVSREQSVGYHRFVTHLFALGRLPQSRAESYLGAIRQPDGSLPPVGDNDDGCASSQPLELPPTPATSAVFPDAGHYVLRAGGDYCFIRCGEFGLPPNHSHAHADLLSPVLWLRGEPVFTDAGTFTYNGDADLRRHFRSAHAHNVVTVDERDYAEQTGTFAWDHPPRGICESWTGNEFCGSHDAYRDLGITVRRRIVHADDGFTITDTIAGAGSRRLRWRFHLDPNLKVTRCTDSEFVLGGRFHLLARVAAAARLRVGEGWHSPSYGRRLPVDVCEISLDAALPVTAEFRVS